MQPNTFLRLCIGLFLSISFLASLVQTSPVPQYVRPYIQIPILFTFPGVIESTLLTQSKGIYLAPLEYWRRGGKPRIFSGVFSKNLRTDSARTPRINSRATLRPVLRIWKISGIVSLRMNESQPEKSKDTHLTRILPRNLLRPSSLAVLSSP